MPERLLLTGNSVGGDIFFTGMRVTTRKRHVYCAVKKNKQNKTSTHIHTKQTVPTPAQNAEFI